MSLFCKGDCQTKRHLYDKVVEQDALITKLTEKNKMLDGNFDREKDLILKMEEEGVDFSKADMFKIGSLLAMYAMGVMDEFILKAKSEISRRESLAIEHNKEG